MCLKFQNNRLPIDYEWLETNGLGGWASSTISRGNTRRYHGLLAVSESGSRERSLLLSRLDETLSIGGKRVELGTRVFPNSTNPDGGKLLESFTHAPNPEFIYKIDEIRLKKNIVFLHEKNSLVVSYELIDSKESIDLDLEPFIAYRPVHGLVHENQKLNTDCSFHDGLLQLAPYSGKQQLNIRIENSTFSESKYWHNNFLYHEEKERGFSCTEDLFSYGYFKTKLLPGTPLVVSISVNSSPPDAVKSMQLVCDEKKRRKKLTEGATKISPELEKLYLAADQFIVSWERKDKSIIAGYHWFADWGRDSMISLPGLCLSTGRYNDAKDILCSFADNIKDGLIPNCFNESESGAKYNSADASLWFTLAAYFFWNSCDDKEFIKTNLWSGIKEIIESYIKGTKFDIYCDRDGLLSAGNPEVQITWMDAVAEGTPVTPRHGKAVELNALWYNALCVYSMFWEELEDTPCKHCTESFLRTVKNNFNSRFWSNELGYFYDCILPDKNDPSLRPNQIFALSLPFDLVDKERAIKTLKVIEKNLLTPFGLRSLAPNDKNYIAKYEGPPNKRDASYHQGTVWMWLIGPYIDAILKYRGEEGRKQAKSILNNCLENLDTHCTGTLSEIFDATAPYKPNGCVSQAWSVAEVLRTLKKVNNQ